MIPTSKLLPPLTAKDRAAFNQLVADFDAGVAQIKRFSGDARVARKRELREKLKTAKGDDLAKIGVELQSLDESFMHARRAAKNQQRELKIKYVDLFARLLQRADEHATDLIEKVNASYAAHFAAFDVQPVGRSPIAASLLEWKKQLEMKKHGQTFYNGESGMPIRPTDILPYPVETSADELV